MIWILKLLDSVHPTWWRNWVFVENITLFGMFNLKFDYKWALLFISRKTKWVPRYVTTLLQFIVLEVRCQIHTFFSFWKNCAKFGSNRLQYVVLKYGSEEKGSWFYRCSILLGFIMSKKQGRLCSELLSEDKITNLLGFLTK